MNFEAILNILAGSTIGLIFRIYLEKNLKIKIGFHINNISIINLIASLFLGMLIAFNPADKNFLLLFYVGFLGSFSTFSSFIYQLFLLLQKKEYALLVLHYFEVLILSFLSFYTGYYLILFFKF